MDRQLEMALPSSVFNSSVSARRMWMPFLMSRFDAGVHKRDQRALEIRIEEYKAVTKRELQKSAIC